MSKSFAANMAPYFFGARLGNWFHFQKWTKIKVFLSKKLFLWSWFGIDDANMAMPNVPFENLIWSKMWKITLFSGPKVKGFILDSFSVVNYKTKCASCFCREATNKKVRKNMDFAFLLNYKKLDTFINQALPSCKSGIIIFA